MKQILAIMAIILLMSAPTALAEPCNGDFDCNGGVDIGDFITFMTDFFFRGLIYENPCNPCRYIDIPKTGQNTICSDNSGNVIDCVGTGQDGEYQRGFAWPNPRFTDNFDGTVTDNLTGLIWLKDANCFGGRSWIDALSDCNGLSSASCGLTDDSNAGDWRLPNSNELTSLLHKGFVDPAVPNTAGIGKWSEGDPFTNVKSEAYWSSSYYIRSSYNSWYVHMDAGDNDVYPNSASFYVWPVRGGQ